jgi:hypothetical protein
MSRSQRRSASDGLRGGDFGFCALMSTPPLFPLLIIEAAARPKSYCTGEDNVKRQMGGGGPICGFLQKQADALFCRAARRLP